MLTIVCVAENVVFECFIHTYLIQFVIRSFIADSTRMRRSKDISVCIAMSRVDDYQDE